MNPDVSEQARANGERRRRMEDWLNFLQNYCNAVQQCWVDGRWERLQPLGAVPDAGARQRELWMREQEQYLDRGAEITAVQGDVVPLYWLESNGRVQVEFAWHVRQLYRLHGTDLVKETRRQQRMAVIRQGTGWKLDWIEPSPDGEMNTAVLNDSDAWLEMNETEEGEPLPSLVHGSKGYRADQAVAYAEQYWNSANPAFPHFTDDCTNFISQCLYAGGIPMLFSREKGRGWWMRPGKSASWSYSWAVAHSLYLLLKSGGPPMRAVQKRSPEQLVPGDVICYDFDGDGRFQHTTIVVAKDANHMPLVNAHTTNSRMRYWNYRDSTAYTPNIRYAFFHIQGM
ncbi:amidase domain-containing protein [Brevibacillus sp. MCWH]|jgi:hypothetical protein|uniref:amidase domain-containing protein n=1 Tax=Brevibacillus sp. MCWH TaxID=2508871 RepID=UPI00209C1B08|nr:amidase domain-containing protein [Brevibacillus sp. MCWH]